MSAAVAQLSACSGEQRDLLPSRKTAGDSYLFRFSVFAVSERSVKENKRQTGFHREQSFDYSWQCVLKMKKH